MGNPRPIPLGIPYEFPIPLLGWDRPPKPVPSHPTGTPKSAVSSLGLLEEVYETLTFLETHPEYLQL